MIRLLGFNGPKPYSVIIWMADGEPKAKTVCYSTKDELTMIERHKYDSFYKQFKPLIVKEGL